MDDHIPQTTYLGQEIGGEPRVELIPAQRAALPSLIRPQHPDEHRPHSPLLFAVDQELGEGATRWVASELSDSLGPLEVREHQDVEQLGAGSGTERVEAFAKLPL
jgi:hypothetical protein